MNSGLDQFTAPIRVLFSDLDSTMTSDGNLRPDTVASLYRLVDAGVAIVLVTGRPAGWGHALANLFPFSAVITENGAVSFVTNGKKQEKIYGVPECGLAQLRVRMRAAAKDALTLVPEAQMSGDSQYREVDLAIDWNEEVKIPLSQADSIVNLLLERGFAASRSSVHVNFGPRGVDKSTACTEVLERVFAADSQNTSAFACIGDSLNDSSMFRLFEHSVGVANVRSAWDELSHKPRYVTRAAEGAGFCELVDHLLS